MKKTYDKIDKIDKILELKIEKTLELICPLYNYKIITDAYIVGSVAEGTVNYNSDIDINLINPSFEIHPSLPTIDLRPNIVESFSPNINKLVDILKSIGIEFRYIKRKGNYLWYQLYKNELFHIKLTKDAKNTTKPRFQITNEMCQWFV